MLRSLLVAGIIFALLPYCFFRPWIGILLWTWISYMSPHRLAYGFAYDFPFALIEEFFKSFANKCACNIHVDLIRGRNGHHAAEAIFKAFAMAVREAKAVVGSEVPSTKGVL